MSQICAPIGNGEGAGSLNFWKEAPPQWINRRFNDRDGTKQLRLLCRDFSHQRGGWNSLLERFDSRSQL